MELTFDKTVVPLRLAQHEGEKLVSRSQAKRVAHRFERFTQGALDFDGVADIGQAFADELFRVFVATNPDVRLTPINASDAVANMGLVPIAPLTRPARTLHGKISCRLASPSVQYVS